MHLPKSLFGYTRIAKVCIGNNVFVGAGSTILPGVSIGQNVIIGAGSVVTKNIENNSVYAGNPAKRIATLEQWISKRKEELNSYPIFGEYYVYGTITNEQKKEMNEKLDDTSGYIV